MARILDKVRKLAMSEEGTKSDLPALTPEEIRLNLGRLGRMQMEILELIVKKDDIDSISLRMRVNALEVKLEAFDKLILPPFTRT